MYFYVFTLKLLRELLNIQHMLYVTHTLRAANICF